MRPEKEIQISFIASTAAWTACGKPASDVSTLKVSFKGKAPSDESNATPHQRHCSAQTRELRPPFFGQPAPAVLPEAKTHAARVQALAEVAQSMPSAHATRLKMKVLPFGAPDRKVSLSFTAAGKNRPVPLRGDSMCVSGRLLTSCKRARQPSELLFGKSSAPPRGASGSGPLGLRAWTSPGTASVPANVRDPFTNAFSYIMSRSFHRYD